MTAINQKTTDIAKQSDRLKKSHVFLLKNPKTQQLGGIILLGQSEVKSGIPTAYTDGLNKRYGAEFIEKLSDAQLNGLVMHENGHVFFRHVTHHKKLFRENAKLANIAADFVVNDMIKELNDAQIELPDGALWHPMFHNWSMVQVYNFLKDKQKKKDKGNQGDQGQPGNQGDKGSPGGETKNKAPGQTDLDELMNNLDNHDSLDQHDHEAGAELDEKQIGEKIDKALREGGILAGVLGGNKNRQISELLEPKVDWREALREFIMAQCAGRSDYTWRRFNNRQVANDIYVPSVINESRGEIVIAIDTSGSIGGEQLTAFASELASICDVCNPDKVRVLWWDTQVHGEQVFEGNYNDIAKMLKPMGGGGTHVGCVSDYMIKNSINAEVLVIFTDGYVEGNIKWDVTAPTMWFVTENGRFDPPSGGRMVKVVD